MTAPPLQRRIDLAALSEAASNGSLPKTSEAARRIWEGSASVHGTLAESYLRARHITATLPETLRFVSACRHPTGLVYPALIARIDGTSEYAVHRTYLNADGSTKAPIEPAKAMLGPTAGGAVRLTQGQGPLVVVEGIETGLSLVSGLLVEPVNVWAALSASGVAGLVLPDDPAELLIVADGDAAGRRAAAKLAERATAVGWAVEIIDCGDGLDANDLLRAKSPLPEAKVFRPEPQVRLLATHSSVAADLDTEWPEPEALPQGLLPVPAFDTSILPKKFRPWIEDVAERMQVPADFPAVAAMIGAGSVIGNRIAIRPKAHDDWQEVPNLWGMIVGRPGVMKSPTTAQAMKPLRALEASAHTEWLDVHASWKADTEIREMRAEARKKAMRSALRGNPDADVSELRADAEEEPTCRRYKTNDSGYQALGELLIQNPRGLLVERDELLSLLTMLDRDEASEARGFYLTAWNGLDSYTFDRIGRGLNRHIPHATISLFGGTQPAKITSYVRRITQEGRGDDGLLQRFSMTVWPDMSSNWTDVDRWPDAEHRNNAMSAFARLDAFTAFDVGAQIDSVGGNAPPFLRFHPEAQEAFNEWRCRLEIRLRAGNLSPHFESHIAKYRKLVPSLALITHLANGGSGPVNVQPVTAALAWAEYLEAHAARIYQAGTAGDVDAAKVILRNLRSGSLGAEFTARDIRRRNWSPMGTDTTRVKAALDLLEDHHWIAGEDRRGERGGRPTTVYAVNPKALR